jgi:hypothetical protein
MQDGISDVLKVAARLARRADAAMAIAANAAAGFDRQGWSKVAQDYAAMADTLRAAVVIDNPQMTEITV